MRTDGKISAAGRPCTALQKCRRRYLSSQVITPLIIPVIMIKNPKKSGLVRRNARRGPIAKGENCSAARLDHMALNLG